VVVLVLAFVLDVELVLVLLFVPDVELVPVLIRVTCLGARTSPERRTRTRPERQNEQEHQLGRATGVI